MEDVATRFAGVSDGALQVLQPFFKTLYF